MNPLKIGAEAPDSEEPPQVTVNSAANNADGDNLNRINDEDTFVTLPAKSNGNYTLPVPLTNNTGSTVYLYGFIDWC